MDGKIQHVVFMCVANSVRSQLAEGILRRYVGSNIAVSSCGVRASVVDPAVISWLKANHCEWMGLRSKSSLEIDFETVDVLVNLTSEDILPPTLAHVKRLSWPIEDPELWNSGIPALAEHVRQKILGWINHSSFRSSLGQDS